MRWTQDGEDYEQHVERDEDRSTANRCIVLFDPDEGYRAEFFAVQEGEFSTPNPEVIYTVGQLLEQGRFCAGNTHNVRDINLALCLQ